MNNYPSKLISIIIAILVVLILGGEIWYHFSAPCSWHKRIDTAQHVPARCLSNAK